MKKNIYIASVSFYEWNAEKERVSTERNTHKAAERAIRKIIKLHKPACDTHSLDYRAIITTATREIEE